MKTYEDLYKDYQSFLENTPDIDEEEYNKIMSTPVSLVDTMNKLVEYGRFVVFTKEWIEANKDEIAEGLKEINDKNKE